MTGAKPLPLWDIENAEAFVQRVLKSRLNQWGAKLSADQEADAFSYLLMIAWDLATIYDPSRRLAFSTYCYRILRLRLADWYRDRFGDSRYGTARLEVISLDDLPESCPVTDLVDATDWHEEVLTRVALGC